jgi:UDP-N-acetylmuramate: L-alanyl-gamma-D-glutamyl-meso-diaminopimelate ligase
MMAAWHVGVMPSIAIEALGRFAGVRRRMELICETGGIRVFDDFAHHPTAIQTTLEGLRARVGAARLVAVIEPRSNTMRMGTHQAALADATAVASEVIWYQPPGLNWALDSVVAASDIPSRVCSDLDMLARELASQLEPGDHVVLMSNGGFGGLRERLPAELRARFAE